METKVLKIEAPEGYVIDREKSTLDNIVFKPINNLPPKTWEEFCKNTPVEDGEYYIHEDSSLNEVSKSHTRRDFYWDRNLISNKETAEAFRALMQLIKLRDAYNGDWVANWKDDNQKKYVIYYNNDYPTTWTNTSGRRVLAFKTEELRDQFLENFRDLIETAKLLL